MGTNFNPATISSGFRDTVLFNLIHADIRQDLEDKVDRNGVAPNAMAADFDLGTNQGLNFAEGVLGTDAVNLNQVIQVATDIATTISTTLINDAIGGGGTAPETPIPLTVNYGTATGSQGAATRTEFDLFTLFGVASFTGLTVYVNGVMQYPVSSYSISATTLVTFTESLDPSSSILFVYGDLSPTPVFNNVNAALNEVASTATAGQTVFTAPTYVIADNQLMVHIDGLMQSFDFGDYTETSTTSITLDEAMGGGERVVIRNITGL